MILEGLTFSALALPAAILVSLTAAVLLISRDWRWCLAALTIQYVGVFVLMAVSWPLVMAVAKMVSGWMAGAVLGVAALSAPGSWQEEERFWPSGRLFRLLAAALAGLAILSLSPKAVALIPGIGPERMWGSLTLIGLGLLHLGLTAQPLRVVMGLLTILAGFEIVYAAVETSTLLTGLLAGVDLGLALAGAYLMIAPEMGDVEPRGDIEHREARR